MKEDRVLIAEFIYPEQGLRLRVFPEEIFLSRLEDLPFITTPQEIEDNLIIQGKYKVIN